MGFLIGLLVIIVLILLGYGILYFLGRRQTKQNIQLDERKQEIMSIPVSDKLYTLRNKNLSGQTLRQYEKIQADWQAVTKYQLPEIESAMVTAQADTDKFSLVQAHQVSEKVAGLLDETDQEVQRIYQEVNDLLASEEAAEAGYQTSYDRYAKVRKQLLAHSYKYGDAQDTLEKNLSYIELDFTKYNQAMTDGDFVEAQDILKQINTDLDDLERMMKKIPELYQLVSEEYEEQYDDLVQGYQHMLAENYRFPNDVDVKEEINKVDKIIHEANQAIADADLNDAQSIIERAAHQIDDTYELMERELRAKDYIGKNQGGLQRRLDQVLKSNRYGILEIDRVSQSYILHGNEMGRMQDYADRIDRLAANFDYWNQKLAENIIAYTEVERNYQELEEDLQTIDKDQSLILASLSNLKQDERQVREAVYHYDLDIHNMKRTVDQYHLPGLSDSYLDLFFATDELIDSLEKKLNRVKLDMDEINHLSQAIEDNLDKLNQATEEIIDYALLTESAVQYANRFKISNPQIAEDIQITYDIFQNENDYEKAYRHIAQAIDRIDSQASQQVEALYQKDKANRQF
ncbi:selenide, water dikinase [Aerococcus urinaehominis]|uniref:Septation ring formation regulator EzrA n=1 Tax=Aerococcus urinaehominis TaxID=128944 RepID=A0A0X8FMA3_9LACT|nr:septation ring formation regulator EzrA [Aerococcus urinaehominis]AMB99679.1 selenide, water dikinase [Aerococcus urinaehominis]SDL90095.1 septation ring formation regulator [Aerococcus urinaehominis]